MFESSNQAARALVNLTLVNNSSMMVSVKLPMSGRLGDLLNNADGFLDVLSGDGEQFFLAKSRVTRVSVANPPKAGLNQNRRSSDRSFFNPYAVLGVEKTATPEEIKQAFRSLVKSYHPDRFANLEMPQEMKTYAESMLTRINLAHEQLLAAKRSS